MSKLRIGIIGAGSLANFHINAYNNNPYAEITAICDNNLERAKALGFSECYANYQDLLKSPNVDAVSVITWNNTHAPITIAALKAGKHVLCEKPPALNAAQAAEMAEAAKASGKLLMYGFVRRFAQNTTVLKEIIESGDLGEIYYTKTGFLRRCGHPGGWFGKPEISGGGPVIDLGVHIIDLSLYLMGEHKPVSVFATTSNKLGNRANIKGVNWYKAFDYDPSVNGVEDFANALIKLDNGASLYFETSWAMNIKKDELYLKLFGDKGGANLEPDFEVFAEKNDYMVDIKPILENYEFDFPQAFGAEIDHFVDCALNSKECICGGDSGVTIMKILDAIYQSAQTGELVKL